MRPNIQFGWQHANYNRFDTEMNPT